MGVSRMPWNADKSLWIGVHCTRGHIAVPADSMNSGNDFNVFLPREGRVAKLNREMVRSSILDKKISASEISSITLEYEACVAYSKYINRKGESIEEVHRLFLAYLGIDFVGIRRRSDYLPERAAVCYHCRNALNSSVNLECSACGWILCACGACGCGVDKVKMFNRAVKIRFDMNIDVAGERSDINLPW